MNGRPLTENEALSSNNVLPRPDAPHGNSRQRKSRNFEAQQRQYRVQCEWYLQQAVLVMEYLNDENVQKAFTGPRDRIYEYLADP